MTGKAGRWAASGLRQAPTSACTQSTARQGRAGKGRAAVSALALCRASQASRGSAATWRQQHTHAPPTYLELRRAARQGGRDDGLRRQRLHQLSGLQLCPRQASGVHLPAEGSKGVGIGGDAVGLPQHQHLGCDAHQLLAAPGVAARWRRLEAGKVAGAGDLQGWRSREGQRGGSG